jgi:uncharacterized phage protein (TIGR01671 family)
MREIKFRGKRKNGTEILIGDLNHINGKVYILPRTKDTPLNSPDWFEVDEETVGQYTGLKDKNGKEIYEGDILKFILDNDVIEYGVVRFSTDGFWTSQNESNQEQLLSDELNSNLVYQIAGNIHENPELIQVKEVNNG